MTVFDYTFLAVLAVSTAVGLWRGLVGEAMSLLALVLAVVATVQYADNASVLFNGLIEDPTWRMVAGGAFVFISILVLAAIVRTLLRKLMTLAGLSAADRFFGAMFGVARGLLIALVAVALGGMVGMAEELWWKQAKFTPYLERVVVFAKPWMPEVIAEKIHFKSDSE